MKQLTALEPVKTWSLIVTLLGDMNEPQLSGKEMGYLLGHVGIKPEAIRVAIHRLKKDGWISTSKNGREVIYRLSTSGIAATSAVYRDVYGTEVKYDTAWRLLLLESPDAIKEVGEQAIRLLKRVYLLPSSCVIKPNIALEFDIQNHVIPEWVVEQLVPADVLVTARKLNTLAQTIIDDMPTGTTSKTLNAIDSATLRLMILHRWRKMALRKNTWAHIGLFPDGPMAQCHRHLTRLLADLPRLDAQQFSSSH
ncbi:MAG: hypothetical protein V3U65_10345 [Granulosicoccaceae bacterium]